MRDSRDPLSSLPDPASPFLLCYSPSRAPQRDNHGPSNCRSLATLVNNEPLKRSRGVGSAQLRARFNFKKASFQSELRLSGTTSAIGCRCHWRHREGKIGSARVAPPSVSFLKGYSKRSCDTKSARVTQALLRLTQTYLDQ